MTTTTNNIENIIKEEYFTLYEQGIQGLKDKDYMTVQQCLQQMNTITTNNKGLKQENLFKAQYVRLDKFYTTMYSQHKQGD